MKYTLSVLMLLFAASEAFCIPEGWQELNIGPGESVWADSSLSEILNDGEVLYGPEALFDGDRTTPWVEGAEGDGIGEGVTILTQRKVAGVSIVNGFAQSERLFLRNNRLRDFSISFISGLTAPGLVSENDYQLFFVREMEYPVVFQLDDSMGMQYVSLNETEDLQSRLFIETLSLFMQDYPALYDMITEDLGISSTDEISDFDRMLIMEIYGFFAIRLTLSSVYSGTHYNDTCISEIELILEDFAP